nr:LacI family transcriptional regulator [Lachnospiraceae bacterium]
VSDETRKKILECKRELEEEYEKIYHEKKPEKKILIEVLTHKVEISKNPEMDLWSGVMKAFKEEALEMNYRLDYTTVYEDKESRNDAIEECASPEVAGIILFGTDLRESDREFIEKIKKPLVIYDYVVSDGKYTCVCIDARKTLELAVDELLRAGASKIAYLATNKELFNFNERRREFMHLMFERGIPVEKTDIKSFAATIDEAVAPAEHFLRTNEIYDGMIMENYQISAAVIKAAEKIGADCWRRFKFVGIDELPKVYQDKISLTQIKIPHKDRAVIAMQLLKREIDGVSETKMRVYAVPTLIKGNTT